jgi:tetratricopeptide (TPR) repeat protein
MQPGSLVSRRVELYEQVLLPKPTPAPILDYNRKPSISSSIGSPKSAAADDSSLSKKGYFRRLQDSFHCSEERSPTEDAREDYDLSSTSPPSVASSSGKEAEPESPRVKVPKNFIGSALIENGVQHYNHERYDLAIEAFAAALKMQRENFEEDIIVSMTLSNLGAVYLQLGDLDQAEATLYESLELKKRIGAGMILTDTLNNLGNCANLRGDFNTSLMYYEEALDDIRSKKGRRMDEINALFNIGRLHVQRKDWNQAMKALNEACKYARELYGTNHLVVAQTLDLMGYVQLSESKLDLAMVSFTGALAIYRLLHGPMDIEVANSLFNVGMVREAKGDLSDAYEAYTTARDLYSRLGVPESHAGFMSVCRSITSVEKAMETHNQIRSSLSKQKHQRIMAKHQKSRVAASPSSKSDAV